MAPARAVGEAFFPLDEELELLSGGLTPRAEETLVRRASWMPYAQASELLQEVLGVQESLASGSLATLAAGTAALAVCEGEVERLKQDLPQAPEGADKQALSADGAFVHLVGGQWVARQDVGDWGGHAQQAGRGLYPAGLLVFAAG